MAARTVFCLSAVALLATAAAPSEEVIFDEEAEAEAETVSSHVPKFTSQSVTRVVKEGDNVTLPCLVDDLGDMVIVWGAGDKHLFTSHVPHDDDDRFSIVDSGSKGNSLVISGVTEKDSHVYRCEIASTPKVTLKHHVVFGKAPSVTVRPRGEVKVVEEGKEVVLECIAHGAPQPVVTWTKKGGLLPYQEKKHEGERLVIPAVMGAHMGDYSCTAYNGVGDPVVRHIKLEVNFAPKIEATSRIVYTGAGHEARMECNVKGQPLPQVSWFRVKGTPLDESHFERYHEGYKNGIRIANVRDEDLGMYSCQAENHIGKDSAEVQLTGKPKQVKVTSEPKGDAKDMYKIRWSVESFTEPMEYKILYRKVEEKPEQQPDWSYLEVAFTADPDQDNDSMVYQQQATLKNLKPATSYQAIVTAKNQYGWSEPSSKFRFSTRRDDDSVAGPRGGEALVSEKPSGNGAPPASVQPVGVWLLMSGLLASLAGRL